MITNIREDWAALAAGAAVVLGSGLITGNTAVWISTAVGAVTAALASFGVKRSKRARAGRDASPVDPLPVAPVADPVAQSAAQSAAQIVAGLSAMNDRITALETARPAAGYPAPAPGPKKAHPAKKAASKKPHGA